MRQWLLVLAVVTALVCFGVLGAGWLLTSQSLAGERAKSQRCNGITQEIGRISQELRNQSRELENLRSNMIQSMHREDDMLVAMLAFAKAMWDSPLLPSGEYKVEAYETVPEATVVLDRKANTIELVFPPDTHITTIVPKADGTIHITINWSETFQ